MQFSISMIIISLLLHLKASGTRKGRDFQVGGWGMGSAGGSAGEEVAKIDLFPPSGGAAWMSPQILSTPIVRRRDVILRKRWRV
jgi:hypothetical protein